MNVLSIQSAVAYGHVGNSAATLPLQRLGFNVWPVDTVHFSNQPAHGTWRGRVIEPAAIGEVIAGLEELDMLATCTAVLTGYLGDPGTGDVVEDTVKRVKAANPDAIYCCDPVMGDFATGLYVKPGLPEFFRDRAVPSADIVTPNAFELAHLTDLPIDTEDAALAAARALHAMGAGLVVATGLRFDKEMQLLAVSADEAWRIRTPFLESADQGAGDTFSALFLGWYLKFGAVQTALENAVAAIHAVMAETARTNDKELRLVATQEAFVAPTVRFVAERV